MRVFLGVGVGMADGGGMYLTWAWREESEGTVWLDKCAVVAF